MTPFEYSTASRSVERPLGTAFDFERLLASSGEAVLIIDARDERIAEANPAALRLLGACSSDLPATGLSTFFEAAGIATLRAAMTTALVQQRAILAGLRRRRDAADLHAQVSMFRTASRAYFLVRLSAHNPPPAGTARGFARSAAFSAIDGASFGFVLTDAALRVEYANPAFANMTGKRSMTELCGTSLGRWLTFSAAARSDLQAQLTRRVALTHHVTTLPGQPTRHVAIEAICVPAGADSAWAFVVDRTSAPH